MKKIAINGFGRIGRLTLRKLIEREDISIVAINDLADAQTLAHLFEFDSVHRKFNGTVHVANNQLIINDKAINIYNERSPQDLPWKALDVDVVLECTGLFNEKDKAQLHIEAGAKKVLLSAPAKSSGIRTIVLGVNEETLTDEDLIVSNASCTTNCLAPIVKIIDQEWGLKRGFMTTVHAYTANQNLQDGPHKDLRRARAAAVNIIPTSTGVAKALSIVLPQVTGKISASCLRVPIPTGSLIELVCETNQSIDAASVNKTFRLASEEKLNGILEYSEKPLVSSDIQSSPYSCILDSELTTVHGGLLKLTAWYDNETGYAARLAALALIL